MQHNTPEQVQRLEDKAQQGTTPQQRISKHVYGGKAALCFEIDETRHGIPTIALDAAMSCGVREYDWQGKVRLQLTQGELPVVAAVLLGSLPSCEFRSHGANKDKGFSVEHQGTKLFVKVFAAGESIRAVPMELPDVYQVSSLFLRQLRYQSPWLDATGVINLIQATLGSPHRSAQGGIRQPPGS